MGSGCRADSTYSRFVAFSRGTGYYFGRERTENLVAKIMVEKLFAKLRIKKMLDKIPKRWIEKL